MHPLATAQSRVLRMGEEDEPLLAVKKGPSTTSSAPHALPGRKDPWQGVVASHEASELGGVHTNGPMLASARESTAMISGFDAAVAATPEGGSPDKSSSSEDDCPEFWMPRN